MSAEGECLDEENALSYFSDELEPEHRAQIERHVDGCAACARLLSAMTEMRVENAPKNDEAPAERLAKVQERYTVLSEHGRGGQARILLAFDEKVGREVALKELLPPGEGSTDDPSWRDAMARFLREAELTGQLVHPGVVPVFDIGSRPDGSLYYTMQLVRGRTLSEVLRERPALPERLSLLGHFVSICQAVAYAHSRGVIHRDIKPQNVMVGEFGETVLLDWGLATQRGDKPSTMPLPPRANASAPEATREGAIIGTPGYMSPEQMSGRLSEVDERSDIFSLGAMLLEILSGTLPRQMFEIQSSPPGRVAPIAVRELCPGAPLELAGIAEKALALHKRDRYQKASELAQDVVAYMSGGRVAAYAYTSRDLLRRFAARHRFLLAAAAVSLGAIFTALILLSVAWRSERASRQAADDSERAATARGQEALQQGAKLALAQGDLLQARAKLRGALELGDSLAARALWRGLRTNPERFTAQFSSPARAISFSPDGNHFAVGLQNGSLALIDVTTRATRILRGSNDQIFAVSHSPDGQLLAAGSASGRVTLWDLQEGGFVHLGEPGTQIRSIAFSPDSALMAAAQPGGKIAIWDARKQLLSAILPSRTEQVLSLAFSPDGHRLVASGRESKVILWDLNTRTSTLALSGPVGPVAFSVDGMLVAGGGYDGKIYLWNAEDGRLFRIMEGHHDWVMQIAVSGDGRRLASASVDGTVRVWSFPDGHPMRVLVLGEDAVQGVAFCVGGEQLAAAGGSRARVWDLGTPVEPSPHAPNPAEAINVARFSPDGARVASAGQDGAIRLWDASSGELAASWTTHGSGATDLCFSRDGAHLASVGLDGALELRNARTGTLLRRFWTGDRLQAVACAPDSKHLASGGYQGVVYLWNTLSGVLEKVLGPQTTLPGGAPASRRASGRLIETLVYGSGGRILAVGRQSGRLEIWDTASGHLSRTLLGHTGALMGLAVDPTSAVLASAGGDKSIRLWDLETGTSRALGAAGRVYGLGWSLGGERLAATTSTGEIMIWNRNGTQPIRFVAHRDEANTIDFSPNGKTAVSSGDDGTIRLWDATTWRPRWFTRALVYGPEPQILTHLGWRAVDSSRKLKPVTPVGSAWRRAVEAAQEAIAQPGGTVCLVNDEGLEIWDSASDVQVHAQAVTLPVDVAGVPGGCSLLKGGRVTLYRSGKPPTELAKNADHQSGGEMLVVIGPELELFDEEGRLQGTFGSGTGVTAAVWLGDLVAVGFRDGGLELRGRSAERSVAFQDTPQGSATRLVKGPNGTLAAGFADGSFGVWSLSSGARLERGAVHGAVRHLIMHDQLLIVASEMGATASMDLSALTTDYCDLLREVWSRVPVLWRDEGAVVQEPNRGHRCASR